MRKFVFQITENYFWNEAQAEKQKQFTERQYHIQLSLSEGDSAAH